MIYNLSTAPKFGAVFITSVTSSNLLEVQVQNAFFQGQDVPTVALTRVEAEQIGQDLLMWARQNPA